MRIGILKCGHFTGTLLETLGDVDALFREMFPDKDFDFTTYDAEHGQLPGAPTDQEGWLITGSKHGAYEDHAFIPPLEDFIRATAQARVPLVGICFGHQIIAQALGGTVEKFEGGWSLGATEYDYGPLGKARLNAWHQDQVTTAPPNARKIASAPNCKFAALAYDSPILTFQAHPEFDPKVIETFVATRKGDPNYPPARMEAAEKGVTQQLDNARMRGLIADFLRGEAHV